MSDYLIPAGAIILPHIGGYFGSLIGRKNTSTWLDHLKQPSWRPPKSVFPPVWTTLYTSMGYASYLVWRDGGGFQGEASKALTLYGVQLALNWAWAPIFFGMHSLRWGLIDNTAMVGCVAATMIGFYGINKVAGYLMVPYLAWIVYANAINFRLWWDNPSKAGNSE